MGIRNPALDKLDIFIGKWINHGHVVGTDEEILTSDVYEWLPGRQFVLHTAYGRVGARDVGGVELIGYDTAAEIFISHLFTDGGEMRQSKLTFDGEHTCTWRAKETGCTAEFSDDGMVQTAHHVRLDEHGEWVPSMEVVLRKVR
ncbi:MAG TPA: hypothetical protein VLF60_05380 [Candidatus Saccharimonadales bacterium]|nr:hypothetical protein [Candidatus Saccharimonadales bacterium]